MTLLRELIEIPEKVHKSDFVISLATAIGEPEQTLRDYVVTDQLARCFDDALSLVASSLSDNRSKATYLHASFGSGKTAMMAVLNLLLRGESAARSKPELAPVVAKYAPRIDGKKFLLVPYHFIGKSSMEQAVLGGYVEHIQQIHHGVPLPAVYVADDILEDAKQKRIELGDDVFFRVLSEGAAADEWGDYGADWDGARFEIAVDSIPGDSERDQLISALLRTHYRAVPGQALATSEGFVPLDEGLDSISRHAKELGYDAVILFLDELVLWLESRMSDVSFVSREGNKIVKLVEADAAKRPAPIVSFIARQRDLKELVGDHVLGPEALSAIDVLRHSEGRFGTITLEDGNLPAIVEKRLLRPRNEQSRQMLDDSFEKVRRELDERNESDVLLTESGDLTAFRRLYPFSPALVEALVALSAAMQRERTSLKVMLQLLVDGRDRLQVGQLVPLGDLWDAIDAGDDPLSEVMRAQFAQARRLWRQRLQPMLLLEHGLSENNIEKLEVAHAFVTDARLLKSLLIAALVPQVGPLRSITVSRLTALNSGVVRAIIPGIERQQVMEKLRRWQGEIGELRIGDDEHDPTVSLALLGIDTAPILDAVRQVDSDGARKLLIKEVLAELLQVRDLSSLDPFAEVTWRGTRRRVDVVFANVRDKSELPDEMLRAGVTPKLIIDFPWDPSGEHNPVSDRARVVDFRRERQPEWTAVWLPNFFTERTTKLLGKLVRLNHVLGQEGTFDNLASYLSPNERPTARAQLVNEQAGLRERVVAALRQAYGVDPLQPEVLTETLELGEQFHALDAGLHMQPPVATSLRTHLEGIADQLFRHKYPKHPEFADLLTRADLFATQTHVVLALQQPNGRLENVEPQMRRVLTKVANPLKLGTMYQAHFIADVREWQDLIERRRVELGVTTMTVRQLRTWLDSAEPASDRRGLTDEVADLVILAVAGATNRVVVASGQPVLQPEVGKLRDEWELHAQDLPNIEAWETATRRAKDMGIMPISELLSVNTVADLSKKLSERLVGNNVQPVRDLVLRIEAAQARLNVDEGDRGRTAKAAMRLVDEIRRRPDHAVDALANCDVPTTAAALGTSIAQAVAVSAALEQAMWELIRHAMELGGEWSGDAERLGGKLRESLADDELTTGLVVSLRQAQDAATDLLARASRHSANEDEPAPNSQTGGSHSPQYSRNRAEQDLNAIAARLRESSRLDLVWEIRELDSDATS